MSQISKREKNKIFISHATPEDNEFVIWLASKLENEGYEVWFDVEELKGGENGWEKIKYIITKESIKFLFVTSKISIKKSGALRELHYAQTISEEIKDFIIPLKLDNVGFDECNELQGRTFQRFDVSWDALYTLLDKLRKDNVPINEVNQNSFTADMLDKHLYESNFKAFNKRENYYSNLFAINNLPQKIYFYQFNNNEEAILCQESYKYLSIIHDKYVISYSNNIPSIIYKVIMFDTKIECKNKFVVNISKMFEKDINEIFPKKKEIRKFHIQLLKKSVEEYLIKRELLDYGLSGNLKCFYYPLKDTDEKYKKIKFMNTYKQLNGKFYEDNHWHSAISVKPYFINNDIFLNIKLHIIFSSDGKSIWDRVSQLHSARRTKGKNMFNKEWRDLLLGFMASLNTDKNSINIKISEDKEILIPTIPLMFYSRIGYNEPSNENRLIELIEDYDQEIYEDESTEEDTID